MDDGLGQSSLVSTAGGHGVLDSDLSERGRGGEEGETGGTG